MAALLLHACDLLGALIALLLLLRFYLSGGPYARAGRLGWAVSRMSDWALEPLARWLPRLWGMETGALLLAWLVMLAATALDLALGGGRLTTGAVTTAALMAALALLRLLALSCQLCFFVLITGTLLSWFRGQLPRVGVIEYYFAQLLWPVRRVLPPLGGLDLSPLATLVAVELARFAASDAAGGLHRILLGGQW